MLVSEPDHPFWEHWWPQGHIIGWEHTFVHELHHMLTAIRTGADVAPHGATFEDGYRAAEICDAMLVEQCAANAKLIKCLESESRRARGICDVLYNASLLIFCICVSLRRRGRRVGPVGTASSSGVGVRRCVRHCADTAEIRHLVIGPRRWHEFPRKR